MWHTYHLDMQSANVPSESLNSLSITEMKPVMLLTWRKELRDLSSNLQIPDRRERHCHQCMHTMGKSCVHYKADCLDAENPGKCLDKYTQCHELPKH